MASICVHRATRTPLDSTPGHIDSRDGLQEDHRPATHGRAGPAFPFPAIHLTRQSPFYGPPGHIRPRDGLQEEPQPATHGPQSPVSAQPSALLQFIWHGNRHSTGFQGTLTRAMAPICVHRARRTPPDSTPGHIRSRGDLLEDHGPATQGPQSPVRAQSVPGPTLSCNSSSTAIAILRASRTHQLARWHRFVSIEHRDPLQTALQGTSARAMIWAHLQSSVFDLAKDLV